ncbi:MAG: hypothetical protein KKF96_06110 [Proteobacteria bacterium]|nr:hypothetical protein [Pseudomonadota bacterium]
MKDLRRTLIYIPVIHTRADMGGLSEALQRATLKKFGQKSLKRKIYLINKMWTEIEQAIEGLDLRYEKVRLYQDGLPVCGREAEIVRDLARAGSRNHRLLLRLMERGATIMGTEFSELLVEEYGLIKQLMTVEDIHRGKEIEARQKALADALIRKRDQYIADRIDQTLQIGETGILFLGMLHALENGLHKDIRVIYPVNRPLYHGDK